MNDSPGLLELEQDFLVEIFNIGVGKAAASLSELVQQEILLSVPRVEIETQQSLIDHLAVDGMMCSISQLMHGPLNALSMLIFPAGSSETIVRKMLGEGLPDETIADLQQEALTEIGNIVINACIGSIAQTLSMEFQIDLPEYQVAEACDLRQFNTQSADHVVLLIIIDLVLSESQTRGYLAFIMNAISLTQLKESIQAIIKGLT